MSLNAAALSLMRDKGLSVDDIVEIALAMEKRRDSTGAERQRRYRDRHKVTALCDAVTPPNDNISNPPIRLQKDKPSSAIGVKKHRFPENWQPATPYPEDVANMIEVWPPGRLERELANFRDYWLEQRTTRPGWDKTWHRRIRDQHDRVMRENRNGIANAKPLNLRGSRPDPALDMWRQAHAELAAEDPGEDPGIGFTTWPALPSHGSG